MYILHSQSIHFLCRVDGRTDARTDARRGGWTHGRTHVRTQGRTDARTETDRETKNSVSEREDKRFGLEPTPTYTLPFFINVLTYSPANLTYVTLFTTMLLSAGRWWYSSSSPCVCLARQSKPFRASSTATGSVSTD